MRTIFILSFFFLFGPAKAQNVVGSMEHAFVNGIRIDSITAKYAQVEAFFGHDFSVRFQYGQGTSKKEELITTGDGNAIKFRSAADLLNLLDRNGWENVNAMAPSPGSTASLFFILKKKN